MRRAGGMVAAALCGLIGIAGAAAAGAPQALTLGPDGETAPVYSYATAIRERVWVPVAGVDQDGDGITDRVAIDIMRPAETATGLKVPAIIEPSPYFTSLGDYGGTTLHTAGAIADRFPTWYDNYFVPRGYAVILAEADGTGFSTGCPLQGGPGDVAGMKAVVDWLQDRVQGFDAAAGGNVVSASWDNGKAAMIGKSYNGTLTNGVAATGVDGLTTIVPISAISDWYLYSRSNGVRFNATHYPATLSSAITQNASATALGVVPPSRNALCLASRNQMSADDGDATGDVNAFWTARDYDASVGNVKASVFASAGLNDDNVKFDNLTTWWAGLAAHTVPRKLWLSQEGHIDPFDYRRDVWVDTLHRWFDYWLLGVQNGIMSEPRVTIERSTNVWEDDADWPLPGTSAVNVFLNGKAQGSAGTLGALANGGATSALSFADLRTQTENAMLATPDGSQVNRLAFLSPVLHQDLHVSGVPAIDLHGSFSTPTGNLGVLLVDYSSLPFARPTRSGDGITNAGTSSCIGAQDLTAWPLDGCTFPDKSKPTPAVSQWLVSNGVLDGQNRDSLTLPAAMVPGTSYAFDFPLVGNDYVFPAGHRIGVIVVSTYKDYGGFGTVAALDTPTVTVDTHLSKVVLPVVGGAAAARASVVFLDTTAPALDLPAPPTVEATGPATPVSFAAHATDDLDDSPAVSCAPASGSVFPVGTTSVKCTATDASGNATSGSFAVHVVDTTAPALTLPAPPKTEATGAAGAAVAFAATARDAADPAPAVTCTPSSGATFPLGTTTVACTARDASGNTASGTFAVTVVDTTAPTITVPRSLTVDATSKRGARVTYPAAASDGALSCRPAPGAVFTIGRTVVTCSAADASGNKATASFPVVVRGAADQLRALRTKLAKRKDLVRRINATLAVLNHHAKACTALAQLKRAVPASAKADVARIAAVVGC